MVDVEQGKQKALAGSCLLLLLVDGVLFGNRVELYCFVLLARVLLVFIIEASVVHVTFPNALFVALRYEFY